MKNKITHHSTKGKHTAIYKLVPVLLGLLFFIYYYQRMMRMDTLTNGTPIRVAIKKLDCIGVNSKSRIYFKNNSKEIKHVNVSFQVCNSYKRGDTITVFANEKEDWYEFKL